MKRPFTLLVLLLLVGSAQASPKPAYTWNMMDEGILYTKYSFSTGEEQRTTIYAFEVDPAKAKLDVVVADKTRPEGATVQELAKKNKAAIVVNGGFFTPEHRSIGLLIRSGKTISPIHKTSWWSIFGVKNDVPFIVTPREYAPSQDISVAVQAGPRLVIDGKVPKLKEDIARRTAVGITKDNKVVIVVTGGAPISMKELAKRMKGSRYDGGLECPNAMALDGGGSTQAYAKIKKFELSIDGLSYITNGLAVFPK